MGNPLSLTSRKPSRPDYRNQTLLALALLCLLQLSIVRRTHLVQHWDQPLPIPQKIAHMFLGWVTLMLSLVGQEKVRALQAEARARGDGETYSQGRSGYAVAIACIVAGMGGIVLGCRHTVYIWG